jgi:hypothetical protein
MNSRLPLIDRGANCLTHFGQGAYSRLVDLWREENGREVDRVTVDIRDLPRRQDLVARLSARIRARLLPPAMTGTAAAPGCAELRS